MADVFISYSRRDTDFVRELHDYLIANGKDPWVDWEDIPPGSRWEQDIDDSIDGADSFLFVLSPNSVASEYCLGEFRHAGERGKRIVPVACEDLDPGLAPEAVRQLNWIWCRDGDDRDAAFAKLLPALDTDLDWARAHTRLLVRAVEWDKRRDGSLLLRGNDLENAVEDLATNAGKQPAPTALQQEYVLASRRAAKKRQRTILGSVSFALLVSIALGIVALLQRNTANERARTARSQAQAAEAEARLESDPPAALARAVDAIDTKRTPEARLALRRAMLANPIAYAVPAAAEPKGKSAAARDAIAFSPDGRLLLGLTPGGTVHLWHGDTGRPVERWPSSLGGTAAVFDRRGRQVLVIGPREARVIDVRTGKSEADPAPAGARVVGAGFPARGPLVVVVAGNGARIRNVLTGRVVRLRGRTSPVRTALLSADGTRVLTLAGEFHPARVWSALDGRLLATLPGASGNLAGAWDLRGTAAISRDGRFVATSRFGDVRLWAVGDRRARAELGSPEGVVFSPDGTLVLAVGQDGDAVVRSTTDGRVVAALPGFGTMRAPVGVVESAFSPGAAFSSDGHLVALGEADQTVRVFELATKKQVAVFRAGWVNALAFASRGGLLAAMTWNGDVLAAHAPPSVALRTHFPLSTDFQQGQCTLDFAPIISPDGSRILARGGAGALVWTTDGRLEASLRPPARAPGEDRNVGAAAFSGDGAFAAASGDANLCRMSGAQYHAAVWRLGDPRPLRVLPSGDRVLLDRHARTVAVGLRAWGTTGKPLRALDGIVALSPDGRLAVVARGRTVDLVRSGRSTALAVGPGLAAHARDGSAEILLSSDDRRVLTNDRGTVQLWDATTGEPIALLGRPDSDVISAAFGNGGRLVLMTFNHRAAVFEAADGGPVSSYTGDFRPDTRVGTSAISSDGSVAGNARDDGGIDIVDLGTGTKATIQTGTALSLENLSFGPTSALLVARDRARDVQVVHCEICTSEDDLISLARSRLAILSRIRPKAPLVTGSS